MTSRPHFSETNFFSKILSENFQHDRVGHIFATCDYMGQKPQKHAFLAILPYPPIYTYSCVPISRGGALNGFFLKLFQGHLYLGIFDMLNTKIMMIFAENKPLYRTATLKIAPFRKFSHFFHAF